MPPPPSPPKIEFWVLLVCVPPDMLTLPSLMALPPPLFADATATSSSRDFSPLGGSGNASLEVKKGFSPPTTSPLLLLLPFSSELFPFSLQRLSKPLFKSISSKLRPPREGIGTELASLRLESRVDGGAITDAGGGISMLAPLAAGLDEKEGTKICAVALMSLFPSASTEICEDCDWLCANGGRVSS